MRRRVRILMTLVLALAALTGSGVLSPASASAAREAPNIFLGQPPERYGDPPGFDLTRLGYAQLSQHRIHVGDKVTETLHLTGGDSWSWQIPAGFQKFAGCEDGNLADGTGSYNCVLKAVSPTVAPGQADCGNTVQVYSGTGCYHNWTINVTILINNSQGTGHTSDYYAIVPEDYAIDGQIVDANGNPITPASPATIALDSSSGETASATTDGSGHYGIVYMLQDNAVQVSPPPGYTSYHCPGTANSDGSCTVNLTHDFTGASAIDFTPSTGTIAGTVIGADGKGVSGSTLTINGPTPTSVTTDSNGAFSATNLQPGTYQVTASPRGSEFPVASEDCQAQNLTCTVTLSADHSRRTVKFTSCVIPNPNGSPLPADTPDPIPGAVATGTLQAVGCFTKDATGLIDSSKDPVRLDGVDASPAASGVSINVNETTSTVTSDGPVVLSVGGHQLLTTPALNLSYAGSDVITDTPAGFSGPSGYPGIEGLPFTGTWANTGLGTLPWQTIQGESSLSLGLGVPLSLVGKYAPKLGQFLSGSGSKLAQTPVGVSGTLKATNRLGLLTPKICGDVGEIAPFGPTGTKLSSLQLCYDSAAGQALGGNGLWIGSGELTLPASGKVAAPSIKASASLLGTQLQSLSGSVNHLGKQIGDGVFLQSIGFTANADLVRGITGNLTGTAGLSFGPEVALGQLLKGWKFASKLTDPVSIAAINGGLTLQTDSYPQVYKLTGNLVFFNGAPIQYTLANGYVTYTTSSGAATIGGIYGATPNSKLDFGGNLSLRIPVLNATLILDASGFYNEQAGAIQFQGKGTLTLPLIGTTQVTALSNTAVYALCASQRGYPIGIVANFINGDVTTTAGMCDLSKYVETQGSTTFSAQPSAVSHRARTLDVPAGVKGITYAIHGGRQAPQVSLTGPGLSLRVTRGGLTPSRKAFVLRDTKHAVTTIVLLHPRGGRYRLQALKGSTINTVDQAGLASHQKSITGTVSGTACERVLHYAQTPVKGQRIAFYEVDAAQRQFLGYATGATGTVAFTPTQGAVGTGEVEADTLQGTTPIATSTLATFPTQSVDPPLAPSGLVLQRRTIVFGAGCGAVGYRVTVTAHGRTQTLKNDGATAKLPAGVKGKLTVTVTPLDAAGAAGKALKKTVTA